MFQVTPLASALQRETVCFSEMSVNFYHATQCHNPQNSTQYSHHCENLRFSIIPFYFLPEPPHPHKPFTKPVRPAPPFFPPAAASILSSSDGNSTKLKARSKNRGLHGMGRISGGNLYTLGVRDTNVESSLYSPSRS